MSVSGRDPVCNINSLILLLSGGVPGGFVLGSIGRGLVRLLLRPVLVLEPADLMRGGLFEVLFHRLDLADLGLLADVFVDIFKDSLLH